MAMLVHEIWLAERGAMCCLAGPHGDGARRLLEPEYRLAHTFEAGSHFEAMTIYNRIMGRGRYTTDQEWDLQPYPEDWARIQRGE